MKYKSLIIMSVGILFVALAGLAEAHVVVQPSTVGIGKFQVFSIGVPVEKPIATIGLRLLIPAGLGDVSPNIKPGWRVSVKKTGDVISEIDWTGGFIPAGQRDDFLFSAQVPSMPTTLIWKAYQTYQDGSVVAWDADPSAMASPGATASEVGMPYSRTVITNDLKQPSWFGAHESFIALLLSIVALGISCFALSRKNKTGTI